ncbi:MAG TPA: M23 family metallopeptidase [Terriglobia bacterium]|nr:M23 family metallopeptidase [Terriglobia bacterium]
MTQSANTSRGIGALPVLLILFVVMLIVSFTVSFKRWEGQPPTIRFDREFKSLGRKPPLSVQIEDAGNGLSKIAVSLKQKDQLVPLVEESYPGPSVVTFWRTGDKKSATIDLGKLISEKYKVQDGPASLVISASDHSWRGFFGGNQTQQQRDFIFDIYPPRLEVLSSQHYINQGGSECVVYRVSPDAEVSGVQAGPNFFPGYPAGSDPNLRFALFAFAYNIPENSPLKVVARDGAGNEAVAGFWNKVFPKKFRSRQIPLDDGFLQKVVPEVMSHTPSIQDQGELIKTFLEINAKLRKANHDQITELSRKSAPRFLWDGAFLQLSNSQVESLFADHRTYVYQGKEVDRQDHVGFDLSVTQQYPIEAANDGVVLLADYFGIYGNTVLIDHGCGLISLYGHLSSIGVQPGQQVKKKEVVGRSGATGLAGGDHLHFGFFLHGVPVNPTEWWDGKWIKDHVLDRISGGSQPQKTN